MKKLLTQDQYFSKSVKPLSTWVVTALCWLFAILFGVWSLPHTVFIRHSCMVIGAILGLWVIAYFWKNGFLKVQISAIPILLILVLFVWVAIHLFWIGKEPELQWMEYKRIWKKIILCFPFALGLGLGISYEYQAKNFLGLKGLLSIIFLGFLLPTLIFFGRYFIVTLDCVSNLPYSASVFSECVRPTSNVPKYFYVFYCLPLFSISLGMISYVYAEKNNLKDIIPYIVCLFGVLIIFIALSDRNGILYCGLLLLIAFLNIFNEYFRKASRFQIFIIIFVFISAITLVSLAVKNEPKWIALPLDAKVAIQTERFDGWKYQGKNNMVYPLNDLGNPVYPSNYERVAWIKMGFLMLVENPWGYGLMTLSFDKLSKIKWPDSHLSMTHSGWIDFGLGYGFVGSGLLMLAILFVWLRGFYVDGFAGILCRWGAPPFFLSMLTTEVSSEIFINTTIFIILFFSGFSFDYKNLKIDHKYF